MWMVVAGFASQVWAGDKYVVSLDEPAAAVDAGQSATAKPRLEAAADEYPGSASVRYVLGHAEHRLGDAGRAILQWERAVALAPQFTDARHNLALARLQTGGKLPAPIWLDRLLLSRPVDEYVVAMAIAFWLLVGSVLWRSSGRGRPAPAVILTTMLVAIALGAYGSVGAWFGWTRQNDAIVVAVKAQTARAGPAERAALVETLPPGSKVTVLSELPEWTHCVLPGGRKGWLPARSIERIRPPGV